MKKIGFIDNFLSEWHANNYPGMIRGNERAKALCLCENRRFPLRRGDYRRMVRGA